MPRALVSLAGEGDAWKRHGTLSGLQTLWPRSHKSLGDTLEKLRAKLHGANITQHGSHIANKGLHFVMKSTNIACIESWAIAVLSLRCRVLFSKGSLRLSTSMEPGLISLAHLSIDKLITYFSYGL